jgi:hypothetical protein
MVAAVFGTRREITLRTGEARTGRSFDSDLFETGPVPDGATVLVLDDSWTSGGNVFSAASALRRAGASAVNAMVLGRLLNPGKWPPAREFIDRGGLRLDFSDGLRTGFDPARSPWAKVGQA